MCMGECLWPKIHFLERCNDNVFSCDNHKMYVYVLTAHCVRKQCTLTGFVPTCLCTQYMCLICVVVACSIDSACFVVLSLMCSHHIHVYTGVHMHIHPVCFRFMC